MTTTPQPADAVLRQHADLMADVHEIRPGRRLDLADQLERQRDRRPGMKVTGRCFQTYMFGELG